MKKIFFLLLIPLLMTFSIQVDAQCAAAGSVTTTTSTTANTCGGNGTITATFTSAINTTIVLIKGGTILQSVVNPTSPYTFTNLQPGTDYEVKTVCSNNNTIVYSDNPNITVADNYVPITDANISISNVCGSFTQGGTFTVNSVTGGNAPYTYSVILNNDPAYNDALSSYSTPASAPPYTKNVTAFGTYQIRIKDACGNYKTFTQTISPTLPAVHFYWKAKKVCSSNQAQGVFWFADANGTAVFLSDLLPTGIKLEIRDTNASGAVLFNGTYTGAPFTYTESASHIYYITSTNACGLTTTYIHNLSGHDGETEFIDAVTSSSGCGAAETMKISAQTNNKYYLNYPINVTVTNSAGTVVYNNPTLGDGNSWSVSNLPMGTYTVTYKDACNDIITQIVNSPQTAGASALLFYDYSKWRCGTDIDALTQTGTTQLWVQITGYVPDRSNVVVTITSGPSNVGVNGIFIEGQYWAWSNILPGTYIFSYTSCGITNTGTITVLPGGHTLSQSLTSTATSFCALGGSITSNKVYTGSYSTTVELLNIAGTVIANSVDGTFDNIAAGTYTTRIRVDTCNGNFYYVSGSTVTITNSTTGPAITASTGVICEDAAGVPLSTGSAYLDLAGVAPYTVQYRVQGSGSAYTTINTSSSTLQIDNLTANTIYEVILTDACGGSFPSNVQIKTMSNLSASNTTQPCVGSPYTLTMPYYAGATYQWTDSANNVLSNSRSYTFANYLAAYDGTYTCKINWSSCVTRFVNVTLNSTLCGGPIGVCGAIDSDGDGIGDFCDLDDDNDGILDTNEQTCLSPISIGVNPNPVASESYGGTTATYTEVLGSVNTYSFGGYNGFDPSGYPSKLRIDYSKNLINYAFRISDLDNLEKVRVSVYDKNGVLVPNIVPYITYQGANVSATVQSGMSVLIESTTNSGGTGNSFNSNVYIDFKLPFEVSRIDFDFYDRANGSPEYYFLGGCVTKDTDGDGIPDYLDLDSDNDGCLDAKEGNENVTNAQLVAAGGTVTVGAGSTASNQNLGITVDANGVPTIVNSGGAADIGADQGQGVGDSQNSAISSQCAPSVCYEVPTDLTASVPVNHGITVLGRAGATNGNWPMLRNSAYTALESKTKGFVITRNANPETNIVNPVIGMMVFDTDADSGKGCLKIYTGSGVGEGWKCFSTQGCP